uniref:MSP domain-containing protein n=1 Tax=Panagrellus redivivus TaxID=6233 RepID=A0A7E4UYI5_PANRE
MSESPLPVIDDKSCCLSSWKLVPSSFQVIYEGTVKKMPLTFRTAVSSGLILRCLAVVGCAATSARPAAYSMPVEYARRKSATLVNNI